MKTVRLFALAALLASTSVFFVSCGNDEKDQNAIITPNQNDDTSNSNTNTDNSGTDSSSDGAATNYSIETGMWIPDTTHYRYSDLTADTIAPLIRINSKGLTHSTCKVQIAHGAFLPHGPETDLMSENFSYQNNILKVVTFGSLRDTRFEANSYYLGTFVMSDNRHAVWEYQVYHADGTLATDITPTPQKWYLLRVEDITSANDWLKAEK